MVPSLATWRGCLVVSQASTFTEYPVGENDLVVDLTLISLAQGFAQFQFEGTVGQDYFLQVSADLMHWTNLVDFPLTYGIGRYSMAVAQNSTQFFRLISPQ